MIDASIVIEFYQNGSLNHLSGFNDFYNVGDDFFDILSSIPYNHSIVFTNWVDTTNFPVIYGSGIFFGCLDGRFRLVIYITTQHKIYIGKYVVDDKKIIWG